MTELTLAQERAVVREAELVLLWTETLEAARRGDWSGYFAGIGHIFTAERGDRSADAAMPPPEHSTRDPWPEGFGTPAPVVKLITLAGAAGWEVRAGYSRAWKKKGRGNVGGEGDARWVLHHFVTVQVRHLPSRTGGWCTYAAEAGAEKLAWSFHAAQANGRTVNVTAWKAMAAATPVVSGS